MSKLLVYEIHLMWTNLIWDGSVNYKYKNVVTLVFFIYKVEFDNLFKKNKCQLFETSKHFVLILFYKLEE